MTEEGNEKITVNYQLRELPTYASYELEILWSHNNYKVRIHSVDNSLNSFYTRCRSPQHSVICMTILFLRKIYAKHE